MIVTAFVFIRVPTVVHWTMDVIQGGSSTPAALSSHRHHQQQQSGASVPPDEQIFLYRLVPGCMSQSFGLYCARMAELPAGVIERAGQIILHQQVVPQSHNQQRQR